MSNWTLIYCNGDHMYYGNITKQILKEDFLMLILNFLIQALLIHPPSIGGHEREKKQMAKFSFLTILFHLHTPQYND